MRKVSSVTVADTLFYRAVQSRDARFDGRFFTAVQTTGVYCRPICPARTPLRKNVRFFSCAAAAEEAGFRPCRRCRPESAPGTPSWLGTGATVSRALRLIEAGSLDEGSVELLAAKLGVGDRQLRRLFMKHLGTTPQVVAASRRSHFARMLLDVTMLPMTEVALASGFGSVRQFNGVMRDVFGRTPSELRRVGRARISSRGDILLRLSFRPPFAWEALLGFLRARAIPGVEEVEEGRYRRTFATPQGAGTFDVAMAKDGRALELAVSGGDPVTLLDLVQRVRRQFDLDADPLAIAGALDSPLLALSLQRRPGLRVPGVWHRFEAIVRAIVGQQVSVAAATTLCGRLARRWGAPAHGDPHLTHLFPTPDRLADADLTTIGLPRARAASLSRVAAAAADNPGLLEPASSLAGLIERLCELPGIGPWTAHYAAMRAFNEPDAFPSGDLGLRRAARKISGPRLEQLSEAWRPFRAYAAMHLWAQHSEEVSRGDRALAS